LLTAFSVTIALMISLTLKEPQDSYQPTAESPFTIFREGLIEIRNSKRLQWLIAIAVLTSTFSNALISLYQPYFAEASVPTFWIGASLSFGGLLAFILQKYAYRIEQKIGKLGFFVISVWPGIMYILLAMASIPALLIPFFILTYASMELRTPLLSSYKNEQVQSKNRATVLSLFNMFAMLYVALMGLVFGKIADTSIPIAFTCIGVLIVLFAVILRTDKVAVSGEQSISS
jgi:hypothetical protein